MDVCAWDWLLFLEYLKVLLSWPPVVLALVPTLALIFRKEIVDLFKRLRKFSGTSAEFDPREQQVPSAPNTLDAVPAGAAGGSVVIQVPAGRVNVTGNAPAAQVDPQAEDLQRQVMQLRILFNFQRIYNMIWGSQWRALQFIAAQQPAWVSEAAVQAFYDEHVHSVRNANSEAAPATPAAFRRFLTNNALVDARIDAESGEAAYRITELGREFVTHINGTFLPPVPFRPW
jgi:hypothetical protein